MAKHPLIDRLVSPVQEFLRLEAAGGITLMVASVLAMILANSPASGFYSALLDIPLEIRAGDWGLAKPLLLWINDGLMAVFFFLIGLELKREIVEGHLSDLRSAGLPLFAALGGMAAPAAVFVALNWGDPTAMKGWAIPAATDIAFALGVLSLLGNRVPPALKAFLLSLAIFDDLGAIIVIALFYTAELSAFALIIAALLLLGLFWLNRSGIMRPAAYLLLGIPLWIAVLKSGVHATVAGVALAMFIPIRKGPDTETAADSTGLLHKMEHALHPWVAFGILPLFALANAGVPLTGLSVSDLLHPVPLGIGLGLLLGKLVGVSVFSWIAVRLGMSRLPDNVTWSQLVGTALLCGIGFTMSLFIASLAFEQGGGAYFGMERLGILLGSLVSGVVGYLALRLAFRKQMGPVSG